MNDNEKIVTVSGTDYRLRIEQDDNAQNPFDEQDGLGKFYSFHRHSSNRDEGIKALESYNPDAVPLSVYSHSGEYWSVKGELPAMMHCQWDSVDVAGCWLPDNVLLDELAALTGKERKEKCWEYARQAMQVLNQYLSGDIWGYTIEKRNHCPTCEHDDWEHVDSCWGFYGHDTAMQEAQSALEFHAPVKVKVKK